MRGTIRRVKSLAFRSPGAPIPLLALVLRALPGAEPSAVEELLRGRFVTLGGQPARSSGRVVAPGEPVAIDAAAVPRSQRAKLGAAGVEGEPGGALVYSAVRVLVPEPVWLRGSFDSKSGAIHFTVRAARGGIAELALSCSAAGGLPKTAWLEGLADTGHPVLGDIHRGGILVAGGLRLRLEGEETCAAGDSEDSRAAGSWWPNEPVFASFPGEPGELPVLRVSNATCRVLDRGHPFILRDDETSDTSGLARGTLCRVETPRGETLGLAHSEGVGLLAARMWASGVARARDAAPVEARVAAALARRKSLLEPAAGTPATDAYRLVHGEADGLPGLFVDRLGPVLRVLVTSPGTNAYRARAIDALVRMLSPILGPEPPVLEVLHTRDRPAGVFECVRVLRGALDARLALGERLAVREGGATFLVELGFAEPERPSPGVGLFLDQRENRARLGALERRRSARGPGGRWLNLFAHTGAFSVALLAAGAREVTSVDLSGPYLAFLEDNLRANGVAPGRHASVRKDARRYLEALDPSERFDGILLDPPTAASAGRRFWSVARELSPLVRRALSALAPGGALFVSRNDRRRGALAELVRDAAKESGIAVTPPAPALPGIDFPSLAGFPEGDPFSAVIVTREG